MNAKTAFAVALAVSLLWAQSALAVSCRNSYVTVSSSTLGVEGIYAVQDDFYVTTRDVSSPPFVADIKVTANKPWYLKYPHPRQHSQSGLLHLAIGENDEYRVGHRDGSEEGPGGIIYVLKLDIEPQETNVCWKSTSCRLSLTDDSCPGGRAVWSSVPAGISGTGRYVTFNPSSLDPGEYIVTARSRILPTYNDTCVFRIVRVHRLLHKIGSSSEWHVFSQPQKILLGKNSQIKAELFSNIDGLESGLNWKGTYGAVGTGQVVFHVYRGLPANSDIDTRTVFTDCGPSNESEFLVCSKIVGIHSNVESDAAFTNGHAWITIVDVNGGGVSSISYGLWGNRPRTMEGTDVHINLEPAEGKYNRYFLLTPTQHQALVDFINRPAAWGYLYTCADWAHDAFLIASGESVSASDYTFGTPRAISKSINKLESITATNIMNPLDGGEEPSPQTSTSGAGEGGWTGDSFPSSL